MPKDFWDEHNFGARLMIIAVIIGFLSLTFAAITGTPIEDNIILLVGFTFTIHFVGKDNFKTLIETLNSFFKGRK